MAGKVIRVGTLAAIIPHQATGVLLVDVVDATGEPYRLAIPEAVLGPLVIGIKSQTAALSPQAREFSQAMVLNRAEPVEIVGGGVGVNFLLDNGGARLVVQFPKEKIGTLRALADALDEIVAKGRTRTPKH